jgi:Ca-activated chloride channel family protein
VTVKAEESKTRAIGIALLLVTGAAAAPAQTRLPRFGAGVEVVNLSVSVTDPRGHYLTDLQQRDFAILEDGVAQDPLVFMRDDVPVSLSLLLDVSGSMSDKLVVAQEAAARFVRRLQPGDSAQVVQFSERVSVLAGFSSDPVTLEAAIWSARASGATSLNTALYVALKELSSGDRRGLRRRAVVMLSDGDDTSSAVTEEQVLELAGRSDVNVYAVSIQTRTPAPARPEHDRSIHFLTRLARQTGGQLHVAAALSELEPIYDRIMEELRTLYTIGYVSRNERRDGKWRRIVVLAPGRESVVIRHRDGYYAPRN